MFHISLLFCIKKHGLTEKNGKTITTLQIVLQSLRYSHLRFSSFQIHIKITKLSKCEELSFTVSKNFQYLLTLFLNAKLLKPFAIKISVSIT